MTESKKYITLDLQDICLEFRVDVKKGDTKRTLVFQIADGGEPYDLTGVTSVKARIKTSPVTEQNCTISENRVILPLPASALSSTGTYACEIVMTDSDSNKITSPNFNIYVWDTI